MLQDVIGFFKLGHDEQSHRRPATAPKKVEIKKTVISSPSEHKLQSSIHSTLHGGGSKSSAPKGGSSSVKKTEPTKKVDPPRKGINIALDDDAQGKPHDDLDNDYDEF